MTLSVLIPTELTDARFTSSTVTENDFAAWSAATTYALGDKVISVSTHRIYQSAVAGNLNKDPTDIANQVANISGVIYWVDLSPTNRWAMLDTTVNTKTTAATAITLVMEPSFFNSIYVGGLEASELSIVVKDAPGGTVIYDSGTVILEGSTSSDYYEYFFEGFKPKVDFLAQGIDQYNLAEVTIIIGTGAVKCGIIVFGDLRPLGTTLNGARAKPKTYSYITTDAFGVTRIVRRKATTDMSLTAFLDTTEADDVLSTVRDVLDIPCVWVASACSLYTGLTIFGLGSGELNYADSSKSELSINVMGLI